LVAVAVVALTLVRMAVIVIFVQFLLLKAVQDRGLYLVLTLMLLAVITLAMAAAMVVRAVQITPTQAMPLVEAVLAVTLVTVEQVEITQRDHVAPAVQDQVVVAAVAQEQRVITQVAAEESVFWAKVLAALEAFYLTLMRWAAAVALVVQMGFEVGIQVLPMELLQMVAHTAVVEVVNIHR
jgi:hypothetical protein